MNIFATYKRYKVVKNFNKAIKKLTSEIELNWSYVPDIRNLFLSNGVIEIPAYWGPEDSSVIADPISNVAYEYVDNKISRFRDTVKITYKIWNDGNLKKPNYRLTLNFNLKKMPQINQSKFKKILEKLYSEEGYEIFFNNIIYFENFDKNVDNLLWSFDIPKGKIHLLALLESLDYILTQSMIRYCHQVMNIKNLHITTDRMYDMYGVNYKIQQESENQEEFYKKVLLDIHLCSWTGNNETLKQILDCVGNWGYLNSNSSEGEDLSKSDIFDYFKKSYEKVEWKSVKERAEAEKLAREEDKNDS